MDQVADPSELSRFQKNKLIKDYEEKIKELKQNDTEEILNIKSDIPEKSSPINL